MKKKSRPIWSDLERAKTIPGVPDDELPEVTAADLDRAVFSIGGVVLPTPKRRGRPPGTGKKTLLSLRVDRDVVAGYKATGPGWQSRMNAVLRGGLKSQSSKARRAGRSRRIA